MDGSFHIMQTLVYPLFCIYINGSKKFKEYNWISIGVRMPGVQLASHPLVLTAFSSLNAQRMAKVSAENLCICWQLGECEIFFWIACLHTIKLKCFQNFVFHHYTLLFMTWLVGARICTDAHVMKQIDCSHDLCFFTVPFYYVKEIVCLMLWLLWKYMLALYISATASDFLGTS